MDWMKTTAFNSNSTKPVTLHPSKGGVEEYGSLFKRNVCRRYAQVKLGIYWTLVVGMAISKIMNQVVGENKLLQDRLM